MTKQDLITYCYQSRNIHEAAYNESQDPAVGEMHLILSRLYWGAVVALLANDMKGFMSAIDGWALPMADKIRADKANSEPAKATADPW